MQRHFPYSRKIISNDFLLNMINHYLNQILACHSKILAFRMDFGYQRGTNRFICNSSFEIQNGLRGLTQAVMQIPPLCGYFRVLEWIKTNATHIHAIFCLKGQKHQKSFPFTQQIGDLWLKIANDEGKYEHYEPKDCYQDNINNVANYHNDKGVKSLRRTTSYLTKEPRKNGYLIWGCSEAPESARQGGPRKAEQDNDTFLQHHRYLCWSE